MSNRTIEQASEQAEYEVSWEAQIDALTAPGLTDEERVRRFADAAGFTPNQTGTALGDVKFDSVLVGEAVWFHGTPQKSLFANLPGCECPVAEKLPGATHRAVCNPTRENMEVFRDHQREARFGSA